MPASESMVRPAFTRWRVGLVSGPAGAKQAAQRLRGSSSALPIARPFNEAGRRSGPGRRTSRRGRWGGGPRAARGADIRVLRPGRCDLGRASSSSPRASPSAAPSPGVSPGAGPGVVRRGLAGGPGVAPASVGCLPDGRRRRAPVSAAAGPAAKAGLELPFFLVNPVPSQKP